MMLRDQALQPGYRGTGRLSRVGLRVARRRAHLERRIGRNGLELAPRDRMLLPVAAEDRAFLVEVDDGTLDLDLVFVIPDDHVLAGARADGELFHAEDLRYVDELLFSRVQEN